MIYEIRTYQLVPDGVPEFERRFAEGYEYRKLYSPLSAFWHTTTSSANEVIHVWPYQDLSERARLRADAARDPHWPPRTGEFVAQMRVELVMPFDFVDVPAPGAVGPVFEVEYSYFSGSDLGAAMKVWPDAIAKRSRRSTLVLAGRLEFGQTNGIVHVWAYRSPDHQAQAKEALRADGSWPPRDGPAPRGHESKTVRASTFSPLQ